jgi:hypothetical protein
VTGAVIVLLFFVSAFIPFLIFLSVSHYLSLSVPRGGILVASSFFSIHFHSIVVA